MPSQNNIYDQMAAAAKKKKKHKRGANNISPDKAEVKATKTDNTKPMEGVEGENGTTNDKNTQGKSEEAPDWFTSGKEKASSEMYSRMYELTFKVEQGQKPFPVMIQTLVDLGKDLSRLTSQKYALGRLDRKERYIPLTESALPDTMTGSKKWLKVMGKASAISKIPGKKGAKITLAIRLASDKDMKSEEFEDLIELVCVDLAQLSDYKITLEPKEWDAVEATHSFCVMFSPTMDISQINGLVSRILKKELHSNLVDSGLSTVGASLKLGGMNLDVCAKYEFPRNTYGLLDELCEELGINTDKKKVLNVQVDKETHQLILNFPNMLKHAFEGDLGRHSLGKRSLNNESSEAEIDTFTKLLIRHVRLLNGMKTVRLGGYPLQSLLDKKFKLHKVDSHGLPSVEFVKLSLKDILLGLKIDPEVNDKGTFERYLLYQAAATVSGVSLAYCLNEARQKKIDDLIRYAPAVIFFELMLQGLWVIDIEQLIRAIFNSAAASLSLDFSVYDGERVIFSPPEKAKLSNDEIFFQLEIEGMNEEQKIGQKPPANATFDGDVDTVDTNATRQATGPEESGLELGVPCNVTPSAIIARAREAEKQSAIQPPKESGSVPAGSEAGTTV